MAQQNDTEDLEAPGWDAIDGAFGELYPGAEPWHVDYDPPVGLGGSLQGCSAYRAEGHWHYVTYGLTELWCKESGDPEWSGRGFEITMRAARPQAAAEPPQWPFRLLEKVASFVLRHDVALAEGHRLDAGEPITGDERPCALTALVFAADPELPGRSTPNGRVEFVQAVGATAEELGRAREHTTADLLAELAGRDALLITDPDR